MGDKGFNVFAYMDSMGAQFKSARQRSADRSAQLPRVTKPVGENDREFLRMHRVSDIAPVQPSSFAKEVMLNVVVNVATSGVMGTFKRRDPHTEKAAEPSQPSVHEPAKRDEKLPVEESLHLKRERQTPSDKFNESIDYRPDATAISSPDLFATPEAAEPRSPDPHPTGSNNCHYTIASPLNESMEEIVRGMGHLAIDEVTQIKADQRVIQQEINTGMKPDVVNAGRQAAIKTKARGAVAHGLLRSDTYWNHPVDAVAEDCVMAAVKRSLPILARPVSLFFGVFGFADDIGPEESGSSSGSLPGKSFKPKSKL